MNGDDWEQYCQKLLRLKFGETYQEVPAQFGGDLGVEGFTRSGILFQCYSPDEDLTGLELYEKQRDKITRDIKKLIKNAKSISDLGAGTIREWHFLTPSYNNKDLLTHCRKKESEVVARAIAEVDPYFSISLQIEDDYLPQVQQLLGTGFGKIQTIARDWPADKLKAVFDESNEIVSNMREKLEQLSLIPEDAEELLMELIAGYAVGQDELQEINRKFPGIYKTIAELKSEKERQVKIRSRSTNRSGHGGLLGKTLQEYEDTLNGEFSKTLTSALVTRLATEAIADWLGRCPLKFSSRTLR